MAREEYLYSRKKMIVALISIQTKSGKAPGPPWTFFRIAMDWSPKSGGKNYAGLPTAESLDAFIRWYLADRAAAKAHPCMYEVIEDLAVTPTRRGA